MRRLTAFIKKIVPFPTETQQVFFKIVESLDLKPGEYIPDDIPMGSCIFIEEGLLIETSGHGNQLKCTNIFSEGNFYPTSTLTTAIEIIIEMGPYISRVCAIEPSRIYYITPESQDWLGKVFPEYGRAINVLLTRAIILQNSRSRIFDLSPAKRTPHIARHHRVLLRAPLTYLAEYLGLKTKAEKAILKAYQEQKRQ